MTDFTALPDLAARALGGSVVYANDELFAARENLINPERAVFDPDEFGPKGKVYDGWETRRRRTAGSDHAIVRLGAPGVVRGVVVDTAWFTGNFPPSVSVEGTSLNGYPSVDELSEAEWVTLVPQSKINGDCENPFPVEDSPRVTHVRLTIYPDGGVARLRVHGKVVADPTLLTGTIDLAAIENGGDVVDCSDMFYSPARNLLMPGLARNMGEGWENARRREDGNDFVTVRLAGAGVVRRIVVDTSYFVGNAPGWVSLRGAGGELLVPRTRVQPDTRHVFESGSTEPVGQVRLDVFPDGGLARLRVLGELTDQGMTAVTDRYRASLMG